MPLFFFLPICFFFTKLRLVPASLHYRPGPDDCGRTLICVLPDSEFLQHAVPHAYFLTRSSLAQRPFNLNSYRTRIRPYRIIHLNNHWIIRVIGRRFAAVLLPRLFGTNPRSHHKGATGRVRTGDLKVTISRKPERASHQQWQWLGLWQTRNEWKMGFNSQFCADLHPSLESCHAAGMCYIT